jgi:hypothetical protein
MKLIYAIKSCDMKAFTGILFNSSNIDLRQACEMVNIVDPNTGYTLLFIAVEMNSSSMVNFVLDQARRVLSQYLKKKMLSK